MSLPAQTHHLSEALRRHAKDQDLEASTWPAGSRIRADLEDLATLLDNAAEELDRQLNEILRGHHLQPAQLRLCTPSRQCSDCPRKVRHELDDVKKKLDAWLPAPDRTGSGTAPGPGTVTHPASNIKKHEMPRNCGS